MAKKRMKKRSVKEIGRQAWLQIRVRKMGDRIYTGRDRRALKRLTAIRNRAMTNLNRRLTATLIGTGVVGLGAAVKLGMLAANKPAAPQRRAALGAASAG